MKKRVTKLKLQREAVRVLTIVLYLLIVVSCGTDLAVAEVQSAEFCKSGRELQFCWPGRGDSDCLDCTLAYCPGHSSYCRAWSPEDELWCLNHPGYQSPGRIGDPPSCTSTGLPLVLTTCICGQEQ